MWHWDHFWAYLCDVYIGNFTRFDKICLKLRNLHLQLCEQCEFMSSIPCIRGLECYKNNLPLVLVVVLYWRNISWTHCFAQNIILSPKTTQWWWCDVSNLVGWFEIGSPWGNHKLHYPFFSITRQKTSTFYYGNVS